MTRLAFLLGGFGVPLLLLLAGHNFRRRSGRSRYAFWGGSIGYLLGALLTLACALWPPLDWSGGAPARELAVHWSMLLGSLLGVTTASILRAALRNPHGDEP